MNIFSAHLAVIRSRREQTMLSTQFHAKTGGSDMAWIGYHSLFSINEWFSVFDEPMNKTGLEINWAFENADTDDYGDDYRCLGLHPSSIDFHSCIMGFPFICKIDCVSR